jgi:hypothetical protein
MVKSEIQSFRHVGIVVSNINVASKIFKDYFGLKLLNKQKIVNGSYISKLVGINNAKIKISVFLSIDKTKYELLEYISKKKKKIPLKSNNIGLSHLSFTVKNIDKLYKNKNKYNVKFINPPIISKEDNVKVSYVKIMDEIILELVEEL